MVKCSNPTYPKTEEKKLTYVTIHYKSQSQREELILSKADINEITSSISDQPALLHMTHMTQPTLAPQKLHEIQQVASSEARAYSNRQHVAMSSESQHGHSALVRRWMAHLSNSGSLPKPQNGSHDR